MNRMNKFRLGLIAAAFIIIVSLITLPFFIERIAPGHVGVVYKPGDGVQEETLKEGWHVVRPFDKITEYPIRMQTFEAKDQTLATSDGKNVTMDFAYNLMVEPDKVVDVFRKFGPITVDDIAAGYLRTRLYDSARRSVSEVDILELFGAKSGEVSTDIKTRFADDVSDLGFVIDDFTLGAPQPDAKTQEAIDARVAASQELDRKKTELDIAIAEADRKRAEAEGIADSELIKAEGTAEANKAMQLSLTPELIQYEIAKKWDGKQPLVTSDGGQIIQLPLPEEEKE